jgi:hypothetical protein
LKEKFASSSACIKSAVIEITSIDYDGSFLYFSLLSKGKIKCYSIRIRSDKPVGASLDGSTAGLMLLKPETVCEAIVNRCKISTQSIEVQIKSLFSEANGSERDNFSENRVEMYLDNVIHLDVVRK